MIDEVDLLPLQKFILIAENEKSRHYHGRLFE